MIRSGAQLSKTDVKHPDLQISDAETLRLGLGLVVNMVPGRFGTAKPLSPDIPYFLTTFRLYGVVSLQTCVSPYKYRKISGMLLKLMALCEPMVSRWQGRD